MNVGIPPPTHSVSLTHAPPWLHGCLFPLPLHCGAPPHYPALPFPSAVHDCSRTHYPPFRPHFPHIPPSTVHDCSHPPCPLLHGPCTLLPIPPSPPRLCLTSPAPTLLAPPSFMGALSEPIRCDEDVDRLLWKVCPLCGEGQGVIVWECGILVVCVVEGRCFLEAPPAAPHRPHAGPKLPPLLLPQLGDKTREKVREIMAGGGVYWRNTMREEDERFKVGKCFSPRGLSV